MQVSHIIDRVLTRLGELGETDLASQLDLSTQGRSQGDEVAWLIEAPGPFYLSVTKAGGYFFRWTDDHAKALRFARKQDADVAMMAVRESEPAVFAFAVNLRDARPVEHAWASPPTLQAAPEGDGNGK